MGLAIGGCNRAPLSIFVRPKSKESTMGRIASVILLSILILGSSMGQGADSPASDGETVIENMAGTVTKVGNFGYGLIPDDDPGTRYAPTEPLAEDFQQDGLRVRFSGVLGDPSELRGRRWGTPLKVTHIELLTEP